MFIGACKLKLNIYHANSLKEKRYILRSLIDRIKKAYNISVAEVDLNDYWNSSELGLAMVSNNQKIIDSTFNKIIDLVDQESRVELIDIKIEIF